MYCTPPVGWLRKEKVLHCIMNESIWAIHSKPWLVAVSVGEMDFTFLDASHEVFVVSDLFSFVVS